MYLIRESRITDTNMYYKPAGLYNSLDAFNDLQLPNCTLYCLLRSWEALGSKVKGIARANYGFPDAKKWLETTECDILDKPKAGTIVVFGGSGNHVAFIEDVLENGKCLITQSSYLKNKNNRGESYWSKKEMFLNKGDVISGYGTVLGFIYVGVNDLRTKENKKKTQVKVTERLHRVRKGPGLEYNDFKVGCFAPVGIYNVEDIKEGNGYKWARLDTDCYIAIMDGVELIESETSKEKTNAEKIQEAIKLLQEVIQNE